MPSERSIKSGLLTKLGATNVLGRESWKERFCVLTQSQLAYYKDFQHFKDNAEALGAVELAGAKLSPVSSDTYKNKKYCFGLKPNSGSRVYVFVTSSQHELDGWINAIKGVLNPDPTRHRNPAPVPSHPPPITPAASAPSPAPVPVPSAAPSSTAPVIVSPASIVAQPSATVTQSPPSLTEIEPPAANSSVGPVADTESHVPTSEDRKSVEEPAAPASQAEESDGETDEEKGQEAKASEEELPPPVPSAVENEAVRVHIPSSEPVQPSDGAHAAADILEAIDDANEAIDDEEDGEAGDAEAVDGASGNEKNSGSGVIEAAGLEGSNNVNVVGDVDSAPNVLEPVDGVQAIQAIDEVNAGAIIEAVVAAEDAAVVEADEVDAGAGSPVPDDAGGSPAGEALTPEDGDESPDEVHEAVEPSALPPKAKVVSESCNCGSGLLGLGGWKELFR